MSEKLKQKDLSNSLILSGIEVGNLPTTLLWSYCEKISSKLNGPYTVSEPADQLYKAMLGERTIVSMDILTNELYGFAQVKPHANLPKKWVLNSLSSFAPGISRPIIWSAALLVYRIDPEAQVIAKVREGNIKAEKVITETGGRLIGSETSVQHYNPASLQPIHKEIYDVTFGTLIPKRSPVKSSLDIVKEYQALTSPEPVKQKNPLINKLKWFVSNAIGLKNRLRDLF